MQTLLNLTDLKEFILTKCEPHEAQEVELFFKSKLNNKKIQKFIEVAKEASEDQYTTCDEYEDGNKRISENAAELDALSEFLKNLV